jgi:hypothetical protein
LAPQSEWVDDPHHNKFSRVWLCQFIQNLQKARASITSSGRWCVSGDNVHDKKSLISLRQFVLATTKRHIPGKPIGLTEPGGDECKSTFGHRCRHN